MTSTPPDVTVLADPEDVARAGADEVARVMRECVDRTGSFLLALAGGSTPRAMHAQLVARHADAPWAAVRVFFGDERGVPPDHADSNYAMAMETLVSRLDIRPEAVHRMPADAHDSPAAARAYEDHLKQHATQAGRSGLDLVLLGMGHDGHTASLFPGSPALNERTRWVVPTKAPSGVTPRPRFTLTFPALAAASRVLFLAAGESKREALTAALDDANPPPAGRVSARDSVRWFVDQAAAGERRFRSSL